MARDGGLEVGGRVHAILGDVEWEDAMRGVKYLYDARGKRTGILIDLERNSALWEDLFDAALAKTRARERSVSWAAVRRRLERQGRLKPLPPPKAGR